MASEHGEKLRASLQALQPEWVGHHLSKVPRFVRSLRGWTRAAPGRSLNAIPEAVSFAIAGIMMRRDHPLAGKADLTLEDLASQTWLASMQLKEQWQRICNIFLAAGLAPPAKYVDIDSVILAKSTLLQSDCIMLLAKELIATHPEKDAYHVVEDSPFSNSRNAYLTFRRNSVLQPAAQSLKNELLAACRSVIGMQNLRGLTVAKKP